MKIYAFLVILPLLCCAPIQGQLVCAGDACTCDKEKTPEANFSVARAVHVSGLLIEAGSGLPFVFDDTVIEVRSSETRALVVHVTVDKGGRFDLGKVPAGKYRLIAAREKQNGKLERMLLADQPSLMSCTGDSDCAIIAVQHLHGTDLPFEFCPPQ